MLSMIISVRYEPVINIIKCFVYKKFIFILAINPFFYPEIHIRFTQAWYYIDVKGRDP